MNSDDGFSEKVSPAARRVVWALDVPPSQRSVDSTWGPTTPFTDDAIEEMFGPRFVGCWVAYFDRMDAWRVGEMHEMSSTAGRKVVERFEFIVAPDISTKEELFSALRSVTQGAATPHVLWYANKDDLWRAGVVPIRLGQRPVSVSSAVFCGDANTPIQ